MPGSTNASLGSVRILVASASVFILAACGLLACGDDTSGNTLAAGGAAGAAGNGGSPGGSGGTAGSQGGNAGKAGGDPCAGMSCDDGIPCTIDTCKNGVCQHAVDNKGATSCPAGQYCTIEKGCVSAPACANDSQCKELWKTEPCKANPRCDAASSVCVFDPLDKDGDGHAPLVCGGDDCDDSDKSRYPGSGELCDGKDNDCDGETDEQAKCRKDGGLEDPSRVCSAGVCVCKPEFLCGTACTDKLFDNDNCGACGKACVAPSTCQDGGCVCPQLGTLQCGENCVDPSTDLLNCGTCGKVCVAPFTCQDGDCVCPQVGTLQCGESCVDLSTDLLNCGACGNDCTSGGKVPASVVACEGGKCRCPGTNELFCLKDPVFNSICVNPNDTASCGACDSICPSGIECIDEKCACPASEPAACPVYKGSAFLECVNTKENKKNCGACGVTCKDNETCSDAKCVCALVCNGTCVPEHDAENCGACGKKCDPNYSCISGSCVPQGGGGGMIQCPPCGCVDFFNDPQNCGGCGIACDTANGEICKESVCTKPLEGRCAARDQSWVRFRRDGEFFQA